MMDFSTDKIRGAMACDMFTGYLKALKIAWRPATPEEQSVEIDVVTKGATYEVKNMLVPNYVFIEESSQSKQDGWIHVSAADYLIQVCVKERTVHKIPMKELRALYSKIKQNYKLYNNKETEGLHGDKWTSTFRRLELSTIQAYIIITTHVF